MEHSVDSYTSDYMHGKLSQMLYNCYPDPSSSWCIYLCRVTHKEHPRILSASLTCKVHALGKVHTIHWLIGISNRCAFVTIDEEIIFNRCHREISLDSSTNHLDSSTNQSTNQLDSSTNHLDSSTNQSTNRLDSLSSFPLDSSNQLDSSSSSSSSCSLMGSSEEDMVISDN